MEAKLLILLAPQVNRSLLDLIGGAWASPDHRRHAARTHDVEGAEDVRMLHADARRTIASHGMADHTTA